MSDNKNIDKEEQNKNNNNKVRCEICGSFYYKSNHARHVQTRKHNDIKYVWIDRIEIIR